MIRWKIVRAALLVAMGAGIASAGVERIEIQGRDSLGSHERIWGRVYFAADPKLAVNQAVADITLAPKNAAGAVEFSSDFLLLRAKVPSRSRGTVFFEVVNRGGPQALGILSAARDNDPLPQHWDFGDRFLLERGFTVAFLGWQFDVPGGRGLSLEAPAVAVDGLVRQSYVEDGAGGRYNTFRLSDCAGDPQESNARLTFRLRIDE